MVYNCINPININEKTKYYNPYYINIVKSNKTVAISTEEEENIKSFNITFYKKLYSVPIVFIYNSNKNFNETIDCKIISEKLNCKVDISNLALDSNILVGNVFKVYIKNICGLSEYTNVDVSVYGSQHYVKMKLSLLLFALFLLF